MSTPAPAAPAAPTSFSLRMAHCGRLEITKEKITGWFHPLSLEEWEELIGFHLAVATTHNAESATFHRWNAKRGGYDVLIPWQETVSGGLSVKWDWQDPRNKKLLDDYAEEWGCEFWPACTIHTHVDAAAFESGTDAMDEKDWAGWHMTIGKMITGKEFDLDVRCRLPQLPKIKALTDVTTAYQLPDDALFRRDAKLDYMLTCHGSDRLLQYLDRVMPTEWGNAITETPARKFHVTADPKKT